MPAHFEKFQFETKRTKNQVFLGGVSSDTIGSLDRTSHSHTGMHCTKWHCKIKVRCNKWRGKKVQINHKKKVKMLKNMGKMCKKVKKKAKKMRKRTRAWGFPTHWAAGRMNHEMFSFMGIKEEQFKPWKDSFVAFWKMFDTKLQRRKSILAIPWAAILGRHSKKSPHSPPETCAPKFF